jgi:hypothetical protein
MGYKLPPLPVVVEQAKKSYDLLSRFGMMAEVTWEQHLAFIKTSYAEMKAMDPTKLAEHIERNHVRRLSPLNSLATELDKAHTAVDAHTRLKKAAQDATS